MKKLILINDRATPYRDDILNKKNHLRLVDIADKIVKICNIKNAKILTTVPHSAFTLSEILAMNIIYDVRDKISGIWDKELYELLLIINAFDSSETEAIILITELDSLEMIPRHLFLDDMGALENYYLTFEENSKYFCDKLGAIFIDVKKDKIRYS